MQTLNSFIDPKTILQDLNIKVNRVPDITTCPTCESPEFHVGQDPNGGGWYSCDHCHWTGDSPQLLSRVREITVREALQDLEKNDTNDIITPSRIEEYMRYLARQQGVTDFWLTASSREKILGINSQAARELIDAYKLSGLLENRTWDDLCGQFVGVASKGLYEQYVNPQDGKTTMPGTSTQRFIVAPLFDAPGRVSGVVSFDRGEGRKRFRCTPIPFGSLDALMFMNSVYMHDSTVFATPDLTFALCTQVWSLLSNTGHLPLLGFTPDTEKAWMNVRPQKLIFWDREVNDELFIAARNVPDRAYVATKPNFADARDPYFHLQGYTAHEMLGCMRASAVPWLQALKDHLLATEVGESHSLITRLNLAPSHRQEILKYCSAKEEREKIVGMIDIGVIEMRIPTTVKNQYIAQRADGWYMINKAAPDPVPVSEAIPVIETYTSFNGSNVLTGHVRAKGKIIPFEVEKDQFDHRWLSQYCFDNGAPVVINSKIRNDLLYYALQFHSPVQVNGLERIGWDGSGFAFPQFALKTNGRVIEEKSPIPNPHPLQRLLLSDTPAIRHARGWLEDTPAHALYWAMISTLIANIIAPAVGVKTRGIGVVDAYDDNKHSLLHAFVDDAAMDTYAVSTGNTANTVSEIVAKENEHSYPIFVKAHASPALMQWIQEPSDRNAFTLINPKIVQPALLRGGWTIINCREAVTDILHVLHGRSIMPAVLTYFVKHGCQIPATKGHLTFGVIELIRKWIRTRFRLEQLDVLARAEKMIDTGTEDGVAGLGSRFVGTLMYLFNHGKLALKRCRDVAGQPFDDVCVTTHGDWIYIDAENVRKTFQKAKVCMPDVSAVSQSFLESGMLQEEKYGLSSLEGWYLKPAEWDAEIAKWPDS